jgi:hypothetical protein
MKKKGTREREREQKTTKREGTNTSLLRTILISSLLFSLVSHHQIVLLYICYIDCCKKKSEEAEMRE